MSGKEKILNMESNTSYFLKIIETTIQKATRMIISIEYIIVINFCKFSPNWLHAKHFYFENSEKKLPTTFFVGKQIFFKEKARLQLSRF